MQANIMDSEINQYLVHLNHHQKEVILKLVKTFANEGNEWWNLMEESAKEAIERSLIER